ncbi:MAG: phosphonoacetaldehyde reductase [Gammaproteobacteria bacterium]|nr:phosphonoacetaldehyde reductase [Gammaproteobacteria bacterium]
MQKVFINQGLSVLTDILSDLQIKNIFFVVGDYAYPPIKTLIEPHTQGIDAEFFIVSNSNFETIVCGCEQLRQSNSDIVIAVGGGRIIDVAKLISTAALSTHNYESIIKGNKAIIDKFLPLLAMPTTAGTGSEATGFSVVYLQKKKYSVVSKYLLPDYVIADDSLVQKMPDYLKACTIFDAFSQAIESFWSVGSTPSSRKNAKKSIVLISHNLQNYLNNGKQTTKHMVNAAYLSGMAINESKTTLPHALSYFLTSRYDIPHGHAVALTLGFVGKINASLGDDKLKQVMQDIADLLSIDPLNFDQYWYGLMKIGGLEVSLSKLGIKQQDLGLIVDSVNIERLKNHPLNIDKKILLKELGEIL